MIEVKNPARLTLAEIDSATLCQLFVFCRRNQAPYVFLSDSLEGARAGARRLHRALFSQEWVPVEQELPPDGEAVFVTYGWGKLSPAEERLVTVAGHWTHGPEHHGETGWHDEETGVLFVSSAHVFAWRFKPEPYDG